MEGYLITDPINILYLTNFKSSNCFLLKINQKIYLFTDSRYIENAKKIDNKNIIACLINRNFSQEINNWLEKKNISKIYFESHHLTIDRYNFFNNLFKKNHIKLVKTPVKSQIEKIREIKSIEEIKKLKKAQKISESSLIEAKKILKTGITEKGLAFKIKSIMHDLGADEISFEPIVAFGKNSSIPHHDSSNKKYKKNEIVLIDAGAKYKNYCGDITRTYLPSNASNEMHYLYDIVDNAQKKAIKSLKTNKYGMKLKKLDIKTREEFKKVNLENYFIHSLGHGIGLNIHEEPRINNKSNSILKKGQVFSIEPGLYLPNKFGIRIEDLYFS